MGTEQLIEYCQSQKFIEICCAKCRNLGRTIRWIQILAILKLANDFCSVDRPAHVAVFDEREFDFSKLEKPGGWLTWPWGRCEFRSNSCEKRRTVQCERDHFSKKTRRKADRSVLRSPLSFRYCSYSLACNNCIASREDESSCDEALRPATTAPCPCSGSWKRGMKNKIEQKNVARPGWPGTRWKLHVTQKKQQRHAGCVNVPSRQSQKKNLKIVLWKVLTTLKKEN